MDGKGGLRCIPIHLEIAEELRALANDRGEIWHDARGRLKDPRLAGRFRRHAERAGITGDQVGPHTLRRSFATRWANDGGGMPQLQAILGHADLATTMEYVDMTPEHVKRAHGEFSAAAQMGLVGRDKTISPCSHGLGNGVFGISALDAATALRLGAEEVRTQVMVQYLSETPCVERADGRRPKVLPPEIAQLGHPGPRGRPFPVCHRAAVRAGGPVLAGLADLPDCGPRAVGNGWMGRPGFRPRRGGPQPRIANMIFRCSRGLSVGVRGAIAIAAVFPSC